MRTTNKNQAIRNAFFRRGMQATPKGVVHDLAQHGIQVDEELVRLVRFELLKGSAGGLAKASRPVTSPAVRRCPKAFPRRAGHE